MRSCVSVRSCVWVWHSAATYPSTFHGAIQHENRLGVLFPTHQPKVAACCGERTLWQRGRWKMKLKDSCEHHNEEIILWFFYLKNKGKMKLSTRSPFDKKLKEFLPSWVTKRLPSAVSTICSICFFTKRWVLGLVVPLVFIGKNRINWEIYISIFFTDFKGYVSLNLSVCCWTRGF